MRFKLVSVAMLFLTSTVAAQSISPVVSQANKGRSRGEFTVTNNSLGPMIVTVEPRKLLADGKGGVTFDSIDEVRDGIMYKVSTLSTKLGPRQSHVFQYDIACNQDCAVAFYAAFVSPKMVTSNGISIALHLPTSAYVCASKESPDKCRRHIRDGWGVKD